MIVKNEAESLPRCLNSIKDVVDEIVLVDTGSTDRTVELAHDMGARVLHRAWRDDFSEARNAALHAALGQWILVIDADEELETKSARRLRAVAQAARVDGLRTIVRNHVPDGDLLEWRDAAITRLFRNDKRFRYEGRIHEQIAPSIQREGGKIASSDLVIVHYGYADTAANGSPRLQRNLELVQRMAEEQPNDPYAHYQLGATFAAAGRTTEARLALTRALELDQGELGEEGRAASHLKLAQLALGAAQDEEALEQAECAIAICPDDTLACYLVGVSAFALGKIGRAREVMLRVVDRPDLGARHRADVQALLRASRPVGS